MANLGVETQKLPRHRIDAAIHLERTHLPESDRLANAMTALQIHDLSKAFGVVNVLQGVSLEAPVIRLWTDAVADARKG